MKRRQADAEAAKAALRQEFPGWSIIHSDQARWWATRTPAPDPHTGTMAGYRCTDIDADTPDGLAERLRFTEVIEPTRSHDAAAPSVEPKPWPRNAL